LSNGRYASQYSEEAEHDYDGVVKPEFEGPWGGIEGGGVEDEREHEIERSEPKGTDDGIEVAEKGQRRGDEGGQCNVGGSE
jgi:hypothetical protein